MSEVSGELPELLERDGELEGMRAMVARAAAGEGALVVVEGQAGVGKTELLRSVGALGEAAGLRVLRGRGAQLDRAFAFGVVRQLLEREVMQTPELLAGGAEPACAVFGADDGEPRAEDGLFGSLQGLLWLVTKLSAQQPLLLVADDLHWADTPSLRWLVFLAERIEDIPVLLVAATRPAEPQALPGSACDRRADLQVSRALLATMAFVNGRRTMVASALGMDTASEDRVAVMSLRAAANQFGYLLGAAAGGLALALGGFSALGVTLAALFLAAALIHMPAPMRTPTAIPQEA
jgi:hypothetical protein